MSHQHPEKCTIRMDIVVGDYHMTVPTLKSTECGHIVLVPQKFLFITVRHLLQYKIFLVNGFKNHSQDERKKPYPMWVWLFIVFFFGRAPTIALACHHLKQCPFPFVIFLLSHIINHPLTPFPSSFPTFLTI